MNLKTKAIINGFDKRMTTEAIKKIADVQTLGIETFEAVIRTDQSFVKAQDLGKIKKNSKAYEDISIFTTELLEINPQKRIQ